MIINNIMIVRNDLHQPCPPYRTDVLSYGRLRFGIAIDFHYKITSFRKGHNPTILRTSISFGNISR